MLVIYLCQTCEPGKAFLQDRLQDLAVLQNAGRTQTHVKIFLCVNIFPHAHQYRTLGFQTLDNSVQLSPIIAVLAT